MIAVNPNTMRIVFKSGLTNKQKYIAMKNAWRFNDAIRCYHQPFYAVKDEGTGEIHLVKHSYSAWDVLETKLIIR